MPSRCPGVAELPALARTEGGDGSSGHFYHQNSKGTGGQHKADKIKEGHRVYSHIAKLQELWETTQVQTIHIPKSMADSSFLKHPELTTGQKRYLCSIAKICNSGSLRTLMKKQYMHVLHQGSQKPGALTHHRSHISSHYSQKQHSPCTTWRHHLEREESLSIAAATPEMIIHSLWRPLRHKEGLLFPLSFQMMQGLQKQHNAPAKRRTIKPGGRRREAAVSRLKIGYASKTRCKSLKTFRRQGRLLLLPVSLDDSQPCMSEETKEEELLNKCMQSMSIQEPGTSPVNLTASIPSSAIS